MSRLIIIILILFSSTPLYPFPFSNDRIFRCKKNNYSFEEIYKNSKNGVVIVKTPIGSGSASLSMGHSIEAHHRNYPYSKESTTTNAFKKARERSVA